ncbi:hypothetical protein ACROYT_G014990 [Oculina patagonica]
MEESTFCAHCTHAILVEDNAIWNPPEELTAPPQREVARQALNSFQESDRAFRIRVTPEFPFSVAPMDWFNLWEMIDAYLSFHSPDLPMIINDKSLTVNVEKDKISVVCTGLAPEGTGEVDQAEGVVGSAMSNDGPGSSGSQAATAGCGQIPIVPDEGREQVANVDGVVGCDQMASGGAGNNNGSQTSGVKHGQVAGVGAGVSLGQMAGPYSASNGSGSQVVGTMARMMQQHFAAADDLVYQEQLEIQLHCEYYKRSVYTHSTLADVIKVSDFFQGYAAHDLC